MNIVNWPMLFSLSALLMSCLLVAVGIYLVLRGTRSARLIGEPAPAMPDSASRDDIRALSIGAREMGRRLRKLEQRVRSQQRRLEQLESRAPENSAYQQAILLAHRGASIDELVSVCKLSAGEAKLLLQLHHNQESVTQERRLQSVN